uniref:Uncharacterized protein n=1 Tax=Clytia hemisphaerica TaxID=252671 RepID=A0A7M5VB23_9CNID
MVHYTMLPSLINEIKRFQEILFKLNNDSEVEVEAEVETEVKVPHDESTKSIDEVTLNEYQHEMIPIYASLLLSWFYGCSQEECEGCRESYPSQRDHECMMMDVTERIEYIFEKLMGKVDEEKAHLLYLEKMENEKRATFKQMSKKELMMNEQWNYRVKKVLAERLDVQ